MNVLRKHIIPAVLFDFIGYIPDEYEGEILEETIMSIIRIDVWICNRVKLLIEKDHRGSGRRKEFKEMFSKYVNLVTEQLIEKI